MDCADYYAVLGVSRGASEAEIAKAYRRIAQKTHPDVNPGDAEAVKKFKAATEAYETLSDKDKRAKYDRFGAAATSADPEPTQTQPPPKGGKARHFDTEYNPIFEEPNGPNFGGVRDRKGKDVFESLRERAKSMTYQEMVMQTMDKIRDLEGYYVGPFQYRVWMETVCPIRDRIGSNTRSGAEHDRLRKVMAAIEFVQWRAKKKARSGRVPEIGHMPFGEFSKRALAYIEGGSEAQFDQVLEFTLKEWW